MTKTDFMSACGQRCIDVDVAMENEDILQALQDKDDTRIIELLDNEF